MEKGSNSKSKSTSTSNNNMEEEEKSLGVFLKIFKDLYYEHVGIMDGQVDEDLDWIHQVEKQKQILSTKYKRFNLFFFFHFSFHFRFCVSRKKLKKFIKF